MPSPNAPPPPPDASGTRRGLVSVIAQTFAGIKTFAHRIVADGGIELPDGYVIEGEADLGTGGDEGGGTAAATTGSGFLAFGNIAHGTTGTTLYMRPTFGDHWVDTGEVRIAAPTSGKLTGIFLSAYASTLNGITTLTVRKNGVDTSGVINVPANTAKFSGVIDVDVMAGDEISLKVYTPSGGGQIVEPRVTIPLMGNTVALPANIEKAHIVGASGEPPFQNSWTNYVASNRGPARFYKRDGRVYLGGMILGGSNATVVFMLPPGYKPPYAVDFSVVTAGTVGYVWIAINGEVKVELWSGGWLSLEGINFSLHGTDGVMPAGEAS